MTKPSNTLYHNTYGTKTVLVTGGAGFIGSSIVERLLLQNSEVIIVDNFNDYYDPQIKHKNINDSLKNKHCYLYQADINDIKTLDQIFRRHHVDEVVHLAARAGVRPSLDDPLAYVHSNVAGTVAVLEKMRQFKIKKLIFASSSSVYGNCHASTFNEGLKVSQPISPYAATKLAGEQIAYTYSKLYNINVVCLRFFTVYGPRQRPDLAIHKFTTAIENNQPINMYGDGSSIRDYTYIDDILDGIQAAIEYNQTPYEIVNLGGGSPISLREMIATIEDCLHKRARVVSQPIRPGDMQKTAADISKAKRLFNFQPKVNFHTGIERFISWYKQQESLEYVKYS